MRKAKSVAVTAICWAVVPLLIALFVLLVAVLAGHGAVKRMLFFLTKMRSSIKCLRKLNSWGVGNFSYKVDWNAFSVLRDGKEIAAYEYAEGAIYFRCLGNYLEVTHDFEKLFLLGCLASIVAENVEGKVHFWVLGKGKEGRWLLRMLFATPEGNLVITLPEANDNLDDYYVEVEDLEGEWAIKLPFLCFLEREKVKTALVLRRL